MSMTKIHLYVAAIFFSLHSKTAAYDNQYRVLVNKSLVPSVSGYYVLSDAANRDQCLILSSSNSALLKLTCYATQYDTSTKSCAMIAGSGIVRLQADANKTTFVSCRLFI